MSQGDRLRAAGEAKVLRWSTRSAGEARRVIATALSGLGISETLIAEAVLIVSELVSNAIQHARPRADGQLLLAWRVDTHRLRLEVTDGGGDTDPAVQSLAGEAIGGRGLAMVQALSAEWGVRRKGRDSTVWALLPVR